MTEDETLQRDADRLVQRLRLRAAWSKTAAWSDAVTHGVRLADAVRHAVENEQVREQERGRVAASKGNP